MQAGMAGMHDSHGEHAGHSAADFRRRFWVCLALTVPVLVLSPSLARLLGLPPAAFPGSDLVSLALATVIYSYGGRPFLLGLGRELRHRAPGMMTLVGVAITVAYAYSAAIVLGLPGEGFFWELATLVDVMLLGHWIEMRAVGEASTALEALARLVPSLAHRQLASGLVEDVPVSELVPGDRVLVRPGEKVPADGVVVEGDSSVDESLLTGESVPIRKIPGAEVIGGSINSEGSLTAEVRRVGADSFVAQVMTLVREAQASKSRTQDLADRAAAWLTVVALGGGVVTFAAWLTFAKASLAFALERAVTVMVIACPHALGLAVPLVVAGSTSIAAAQGLLLRSRPAFEAARDVRTVVFDKTGTLTEGRFAVTEVLAFGESTRDEVLRLAAAVESLSEHPLARGIAAAASTPSVATGFRAIPGQGAEADVEGRHVIVASPGYVRRSGVEEPDTEAVERLEELGQTAVYVLADGRPIGVTALADVVRPTAREAVRALRELGIRTLMLTGDDRRVAARVSAEVGLDDFVAEVRPADKAARVREVRERDGVTAMVGDGVNDAAALAEADIGIAIGAGTDVAIASADVVLVRSDPRDVVTTIRLARATYRKMLENLAWAVGYNVVAIPLAAGVLAGWGVLLPPALGGALMAASTVIVAVNARSLAVRL
jgi:P-type Cu2+ transporter